MCSGDGRRASNIDVSRGQGSAEEGVTNELVDSDQEAANRRSTKRQRRRRQQLFGERYEGCRRTLVCTLVEQPPQKYGQVNKVEKPTERRGYSAVSAARRE
jgi:hypothetical protein